MVSHDPQWIFTYWLEVSPIITDNVKNAFYSLKLLFMREYLEIFMSGLAAKNCHYSIQSFHFKMKQAYRLQGKLELWITNFTN